MEFGMTFWTLAVFFGGFWYGSYVTGIAYKRNFQIFRDELYKQYVEALKIMRDKIYKELEK